MSKFKVGDRVRCIANHGEEVVLGNTHVVCAEDNFYIKINKWSNYWYMSDLFEIVVEPQYPNPPHKHRDLIVAWANGADIEFSTVSGSSWCVVKNPVWDGNTQYRIKPTKSAKDIEIEQIQAEMDKLKERLEKVKEGK